MHSLRFKMTAISIVAILTAVFLVFLASLSTVQAQSERNSVEVMNLLVQDTGKSLEKYIDDVEQSIDMIARIATSTLDSVELVKDGAAGSAARQSSQTTDQMADLDEYLSGYYTQMQGISATVASRTHGAIAYYYCTSPTFSASNKGFFYAKVGKTGFVAQEPIDVRNLDSADMEHNAWWFEAVERGRPSWVGPYTSRALGERSICSYVVPIYKAGTFIGVVGMDILTDVLIEQVGSIRVYDTGFACLLDEEGRVVYHPTLPFGSVPELSIGSEVLAQNDSSGELVHYESAGQERLMAFTALTNGMKLVVVAPAKEVNASSTQLVFNIIPIAVLIVVLFAILSLLLMRAITNPLRLLTAAAQRLANEDYDVELDYKGKDEVGSLTKAFQRMRDQLKESIEDLNRKALTDDLTGLANQRHFFELAEHERKRFLDAGKRPVMLYFNLAGMKHFNRQYGFDEGDKLICAVADVLVEHFGMQRTGRFGQDHFAVVTDDEHLESRLRVVFRDCKDANGGLTVPVNVGIYCDSLGEVNANVACDRAKFACDKRRGSYISGFAYFDEGMLKQVDIVRHVIEHLDQALEEQWVEVYYQPIVRATNGGVCDDEALARWIDPELGFLSPDEFVPALESAGLIYKLDLYMLDQVLDHMKIIERRGYTVVPHSINLSRSDFESCDIVEEIRARVDAAGFDRSKITIEITESIIGLNFDFMKQQIERFQALGFQVWMDDFGSGYSSLDVLKQINFDVIKFDMSFMRGFDEGGNGKVILTEMMKMATALGVDTVCEGVETEEQRRFLQEIGCSKLQGYYFCKPIPFSELLRRHETGLKVGFENPAESEYYEAIGKFSLHDLTAIASKDDSSLQNAFDTLPMAVMEVKDDEVRLVRSNQSHRDFVKRFFSFDTSEQAPAFQDTLFREGSSLMNALHDCCEGGGRVFFDDRLPDGSIAHTILRRIKTNPVTSMTAVAVAVLSVSDPDEGATYASIARALARDYYNIYYVDLDTGYFIEYRSPVGGESLVKERHGEHFFEETVGEVQKRVYADDRDGLLTGFTRENVLHDLDVRGVFTASYRLVDTGEPMSVNMKVTRMEPGSNRVIIGVSIV